MKGIISKFVKKHYAAILSFVSLIAPVAVYSCRGKLYEPKEPVGLESFAKTRK